MPTYAAMEGAIFAVPNGPTDAGPREANRSLIGEDIECVAASSAEPNRAVCGTFGSGLYLTDDGGETWRRTAGSTIGPDAAVTSVAVSPRTPDRMWAGTEPSAVYRTDDGGDAWRELADLTTLPSSSEWYFPPRPSTHHVRWIEPDPADGDHLYVGIEAGALVQTHDGGETWEDRRPDARRDNHSLATHPDAPGRAYAAAGDGYAETTDGGGTWTHPQEGLEHRYCWSVAVDPDDPKTRVLSAASGPRAAHTPSTAEAYVYRRRGDEPWRRLDETGVPTGDGVLRQVLAPGIEGGEFYALTNRGLYRSADRGTTWTRIDIRWPEAFESQTPQGLAVV